MKNWDGNDPRGVEDIVLALGDDGSTFWDAVKGAMKHGKGFWDRVGMVLEGWSIQRTIKAIKKRRKDG